MSLFTQCGTFYLDEENQQALFISYTNIKLNCIFASIHRSLSETPLVFAIISNQPAYFGVG